MEISLKCVDFFIYTRIVKAEVISYYTFILYLHYIAFLLYYIIIYIIYGYRIYMNMEIVDISFKCVIFLYIYTRIVNAEFRI